MRVAKCARIFAVPAGISCVWSKVWMSMLRDGSDEEDGSELMWWEMASR